MKKWFKGMKPSLLLAVLFMVALVTVAARYEVLDVHKLNVFHSVVFEGATTDGYETTITGADPTADRTITFPDATGTIGLVGAKALSSSSGYTAGTGMSISAADVFRYRTFFVDATSIGASCSTSIGPADGTGVTVVLPTPTSAMDGLEITLFNKSGTTDVFAYAGGIPIDTTSGTTDALTADGAGDAMTLVADYDSGVSWFIKSSRIH